MTDPTELVCRRCGAEPAQPCVDRSGRMLARLHASRGRDAAAAEAPIHPGEAPPAPRVDRSQVAPELRVSRETARMQTCPRCGAGRGQPCVEAAGQPRRRNHLARAEAAVVARNGVLR